MTTTREGYCRSCGWVSDAGARCEDCGGGPLVQRPLFEVVAELARRHSISEADIAEHAENTDRLVHRGLARPVSPFTVVAELVYDAETDRLES